MCEEAPASRPAVRSVLLGAALSSWARSSPAAPSTAASRGAGRALGPGGAPRRFVPDRQSLGLAVSRLNAFPCLPAGPLPVVQRLEWVNPAGGMACLDLV